jgi:hypothetical protein
LRATHTVDHIIHATPVLLAAADQQYTLVAGGPHGAAN